ncbi:hypothetical protein [Vibrio maerlii]|uniref:hypothetical protein n=1 Tax=Vibrio maerlii TaxID=2231648 RepID=UPI000E3CD611|nr:hypothetical protein [Vibrio maerlii]
MNMLTMDHTKNQNDKSAFIAQAVFAVESINAQQQTEKQTKAKQMLDQLFPLENGSHGEVTSYEIDYRHVQAYFADGTHSGLRNPGQFVAYTGHKCSPDSILFRDKSGTHMDVMFARCKGTGKPKHVEISDIEMETCTTFGDMQGAMPAIRHWISLVQGDEKGKPRACSGDKEFTAKNGEDYQLDCCYEVK